MKKRKLKKNVYIIFIFLMILAFTVIICKNHFEKNVEKSKEKVNITENQIVSKIKNEIYLFAEKYKEQKISLFAVGDVLIHESVYKDAYKNNTYDFSHMFTHIQPILKKYDLKFCNQESIIGGSYLGISGYPSFNSPDEIGDELVKIGFNMISLANNHSMDKGEDAVLYSNSYWKSKNVITAGSYSNFGEMNDIKVYEQNGIKYGYLAYTTVLNGYKTKDYLVNVYSDSKVKNDIDKIKDKVDIIIVSMHWGEENTNIPTASQKNIAKYLSSIGVDLIIGHHPHVVQPVEFINNTLVIYSLGNFISNQLVLGINQGIGLMVGVDIVKRDEEVMFENIYKELILSYSENSTNFKVIPFSKLDDSKLNNYKSIESQYMSIVNGG